MSALSERLSERLIDAHSTLSQRVTSGAASVRSRQTKPFDQIRTPIDRTFAVHSLLQRTFKRGDGSIIESRMDLGGSVWHSVTEFQCVNGRF